MNHPSTRVAGDTARPTSATLAKAPESGWIAPPGPATRALAAAGSVLVIVLGVAWQLIRVALCAVMVLLEPLLRILLVPLAYLSFLVTLFFGFLVGAPNFPKWGMLAFSVGALVLYWLYLGVMAVVIGGGRGRD